MLHANEAATTASVDVNNESSDLNQAATAGSHDSPEKVGNLTIQIIDDSGSNETPIIQDHGTENVLYT